MNLIYIPLFVIFFHGEPVKILFDAPTHSHDKCIQVRDKDTPSLATKAGAGATVQGMCIQMVAPKDKPNPEQDL